MDSISNKSWVRLFASSKSLNYRNFRAHRSGDVRFAEVYLVNGATTISKYRELIFYEFSVTSIP